MANDANKCTIMIDDANLVEVVSEHQCSSLEQWRVHVHRDWREADQLLCRNSMHSGDVAVDLLPRNNFQDIHGMDSSLRSSFMIDDKDVIPIV